MSHARSVTLNPIDVVEAGYQFESNDRDWLANLAQLVYPLLDGGLGMFVYRYDVAAPPATWTANAHLVDMTRDEYGKAIQMLSFFSTADANKLQTAPAPLSTLSSGVARRIGVLDPFDMPEFQQMLGGMGARDVCALRTVETGGKGVVFCALQRERRTINPRMRALWSKVSVHLAAARRLREDLLAAEGAPVEAILTPSGRVAHAEGEAKTTSIRDLLRNAVLRQERARGRTRRQDPVAATSMWNALVSGRWSLVDQFESNGRRLIVARRNELGCRDPRALSPRERDIVHLVALGKSNKLIAYELGLAESTVATHLSTAMRKLGARSRVDIVSFLSGIAPT